MNKPARTYQLSAELVAAHAGGPVVCLDQRALGREFALHAVRPGAQTIEEITRAGMGLEPRADVITTEGGVVEVTPSEPDAKVIRVDVFGVLEQRAGYHDLCGGWSDGHDTVAERMIAALADGDVVMVIDSPGGAHAGLQEAVRKVQAAKLEFGRTVLAYADEQVGSAAYWWAACIADAIYLPPAGTIGSIGARAAHQSVAGAMEQAGVVATYFAWPGPGKVAFAPELPLSDTGRERGERDVSLAGEAFAAAVLSYRGISRDDIVALDADVLTGQAAVDAGLADGVASLEEVFTLALTKTESDMAIETNESKSNVKADEEYERTTKERYTSTDGDEPKEPEPSEAGDEDEPEPEEEGDTPDQEERTEDPPPPAKKDGPPAAAARAPKSLAALAGLREGASTPAILSALIPIVGFARSSMSALGAKTSSEARGLLKAALEDAGAAGELRTKLRDEQRKGNFRERMDLLRKFAAADLPGYTRGELLVDDVDEVSGKRTIRPAKQYAEMKLGTLRGLVEGKLKNRTGPAPKRTPFDPDPERAKTSADTANVQRVVETPLVQKMATRSTASAEQLARTYAALQARGDL